jgi:hypothetical protein
VNEEKKDPRQPREIPLSPADAPRRERDQVPYRRSDEVDRLGEITGTDIYHGELEAGVHDDLPGGDEAENVEMLTERELRDGETGDAGVAAEEGMTYVPPSDPPVTPDEDRQGAEVAAGFGTTAIDEPIDQDHRSRALSDGDEMSARVREALRADAATSRYADSVAIGTRGNTVALRGVVDDLEDSDSLVEVANRVSGVEEVIDELEVRGL